MYIDNPYSPLPDDVQALLRELDYHPLTTGQQAYKSEHSDTILTFQPYASPHARESVSIAITHHYVIHSAASSPCVKVKSGHSRKTVCFALSDAVEEIKDYLRSCHFDVDTVLRQRRLRALLS